MLIKKVKYQGGITKRIAILIGDVNKTRFQKILTTSTLDEILIELKKTSTQKLEIELVSFSSSRDFCEQIFSILSFLRYAGEPVKWTIYSDGTHSNDQLELLQLKFKFVELVLEDVNNTKELSYLNDKRLTEFANELLHYARTKPLGRKVLNYLNHPITIPTIFLDSDIVFYSGIRKGIALLLDEDVDGWFLPDTNWGCLDSQYLADTKEQLYQVNGGFYLAKKPLATIDEALFFLRSLNQSYEYFTDQTMMHIYCKACKFYPLDSRKFIINTEDQFDFSYKFKPEEIAMRHYTGPVRHKMWQKSFTWHLSLKNEY